MWQRVTREAFEEPHAAGRSGCVTRHGHGDPARHRGPPEGGAPSTAASPGSSHLEAPVGADRTTGLIPDHGSRHVPRTLWLAAYASRSSAPSSSILVRDDAPPRSFILELGSALGIAA